MTAPGTSPNQAAGLRQWFARRPYGSLTLLVIVTLGPFLAKPFNIDDPLFVWAAQHINQAPADPYGFNVNWYGVLSPMWEITKNPPLACYYLALAGRIFGWSEPVLHGAMLLPAIAVILGTYRLARRFCPRPGLAAGLTLFTPVFLVSSNTLMCDTLMLAFWMWAMVLWIEGLEQNHLPRLAAAGVLAALAELTKYFGVSLIPLLLAYTLIRQRKFGHWIWCLLIPVAALAAYLAATHALYGMDLLGEAGRFAQTGGTNPRPPWMSSALIALAFTGGCLAIVTFLIPALWPVRTQLVLVGTALVIVAAVFTWGSVFKSYGQISPASLTLVKAQVALWTIGGLGVLALAVAEFRRERNLGTSLLGLWVLGTFVFTAFCNWTVNGRSILPLVPAVAILVARRWELLGPTGSPRRALAVGGTTLGAGMALLIAGADYRLAVSVRRSAEETVARYGGQKNALWFDAHWGFQYYMQALGAGSINWQAPQPQKDDVLAFAQNNVDVRLLGPEHIRFQGVVTNQMLSGVTTLHRTVGACFYSSNLGPLPFAFGRVPPEIVFIYAVGPDTNAVPHPSSP